MDNRQPCTFAKYLMDLCALFCQSKFVSQKHSLETRHSSKSVSKNKLIAAQTLQHRCYIQHLLLIITRTKYCEGSFVPRTIKNSNTLPSGVVAAATAETFGSRLAH